MSGNWQGPPPPDPDPWTPGPSATPPPGPEQATPTGMWFAQPPPPPRRRSRVLMGALAAVGAVIGIFVVRVAIGMLAVGAVSGAISSFLGGPLNRLPADVRSGYEARLKSAIGTRLDGMTDTQANETVQGLVLNGMLRLEDARVIRRLELQTRALDLTDMTTCAQFGRASFGGTQIADETAERLIGALDTDALGEWMGIMVDAVEAETHGTPPQQHVSDQAAIGVIQALIQRLPTASRSIIADAADGTPASDSDTCTAVRTLYDSTLGLPDRSKVIVARFDVQAGD